MYKNKLKLNPYKTEFLLIGNKCHRKNFTSSFPIDILGNQISPKPTARNLGLIFDSDFNFIAHINSIARVATTTCANLGAFANLLTGTPPYLWPTQ